MKKFYLMFLMILSPLIHTIQDLSGTTEISEKLPQKKIDYKLIQKWHKHITMLQEKVAHTRDSASKKKILGKKLFIITLYTLLEQEYKAIETEEKMPGFLTSTDTNRAFFNRKRLLVPGYKELIEFTINDVLVNRIYSYADYCKYLTVQPHIQQLQGHTISLNQQLTLFKTLYKKSSTLKKLFKNEITQAKLQAQDLQTTLENLYDLKEIESLMLKILDQDLILAQLTTLDKYFQQDQDTEKNEQACINNLISLKNLHAPELLSKENPQESPSFNFKI